MERALGKLCDELRFIQERRSKLSIMKLGFVATFFGIASLKLGTTGEHVSRTALYLVPLVAVLFDIFGIASTIGIHKLETFLGKHIGNQNDSDILRKWRVFSQEHRLPHLANVTSHMILTANAFVVPIGVLLMYIVSEIGNYRGCWFKGTVGPRGLGRFMFCSRRRAIVFFFRSARRFSIASRVPEYTSSGVTLPRAS